MEDLFLKCKNIVKENINKDLNDDIIDLISLALMGLMLFNQELTKKYLIPKLKELDVYFGNETVLEMAHKYLNNYQEDDSFKKCDAAITRSFSIINENNDIKIETEKHTLFVSLKNLTNSNLIEIISQIIHEFLHLIRFGGYVIKNHEINIKDGISTSYYNYDTAKLKRKHRNIEEGIVEKYTKDTIKLLSEYIIKNYNIQILNDFSKNIKLYDYNSKSYEEIKLIVNTLCKDSTFNNLLLKTFEEETSPSNLILYFNDIMESSSAFTLISKNCDEYLSANDKSKENEYAKDVFDTIKLFLIKCRSKQTKKNLGGKYENI